MEGLLREVNARHGRLTYFANDTGAVSRALATYGEWAENEISFVCRLIPSGGVVLDIGAYIGTHTLAFARHVGAHGQVIAVEAQPATFEVLSRNVADNQLANVRLENLAMGNTEGERAALPIDIAHAGSFGSASINGALHGQQAAPGNPPVMMRLSTIDALHLQACDLIKIDAEGAESLIIEGAAETIRRLKPAIYAECNSVADGLLSLEQLRHLGYVARLHLVNAFADSNFFNATENVFGAAREAALVAVPAADLARLESIVARPCEKLITLETADDLVLGMLNKPQYIDEILRPSHAAASGAAAWLDQAEADRKRLEALSEDVHQCRTALESERAHHADTVNGFAGAVSEMRDILREDMSRLGSATADMLERLHDRIEASFAEARAQNEAEARMAREERQGVQMRLDATAAALEGVSRALALQQREMQDQRACFEAAMRQARIARELADSSVQETAEAQRQLHHAILAHAATAAQAATAAACVERQTAEMKELRRDLAQIRESTSWRITSPIRWLVDLGRNTSAD